MRSDKHIHVHVHVEPDPSVLNALARIDSRLTGLTRGVQAMALDVSAVEAEISENTDAIASAEVLLASLAQAVRDTAGDPAAVAALAASLDANNTRLSAAIVANTPQVESPA